MVNWRLSGSLPRGEYPQPAPAPLSAGRAFLLHDRELDKASFGPAWLQNPRGARMVAATLESGDRQRHFDRLSAWVIMPNHVHVVLRPEHWQAESFDHRIRDAAELERIAAYVERNPVAAGLVRKPGDWPWSSARLAGETACPE